MSKLIRTIQMGYFLMMKGINNNNHNWPLFVYYLSELDGVKTAQICPYPSPV